MQSENDDLILTFPHPFTRQIRVSYGIRDDRIVIVLTGKRCDLLSICPYVNIDDDIYLAEPLDLKTAAEIIEKRYGEGYFATHYREMGKRGYSLCQFHGKPDIVGSVERLFDSLAHEYQANLTCDPLQRSFRVYTAEFLSRFLNDGISILEVGCNDAAEIRMASCGRAGISYTCADLSMESIQIASESTSDLHDRKFIKCRYGEYRLNGEYDIIFSTFGALDIMEDSDIMTIVDHNLKTGGYFIGTFLNKYSISDILLSIFTGNSGYARQRIRGSMLPENGRYPVVVKCRSRTDLHINRNIHLRGFRGISLLWAPYNYKRVNRILMKIPFLKPLDHFLSGNGILGSLSEYLLFSWIKT